MVQPCLCMLSLLLAKMKPGGAEKKKNARHRRWFFIKQEAFRGPRLFWRTSRI